MFLKYFPDDADVCILVNMVTTMTQSALLRIYEIIELEKRPLTEQERGSLKAMIEFLVTAKHDAERLNSKMLN